VTKILKLKLHQRIIFPN